MNSSKSAGQTSPFLTYGLWILLSVALVMRLVYLAPGLLGGDSIGYAIGGLGTWIAHPPGFFGYCFLGWLVNQAVGNINHSMLIINVVCCLVGIFCCHRLAKSVGLSDLHALIATAAYGFSIDNMYFSDIALSYAPEGMFATALGLCVHRAIKLKKLSWALAATLIWAVSGALRQTSSSFLFPLWVLMLWRGKQLRFIHWHLLVAVPIVAGWTHANTHYLNAAAGNPPGGGAAHGFWALQVMMPSNHDPTKLGLDEDVKEEATSQYHWPFIEILTLVDEKLGTHVLPPYQSFGAPPPSLAHAANLTGMQALKLSFYTLFALPSLLVAVGSLLLRKKPAGTRFLSFEDWLFFAAWILPSGLFFLIGHFGSFGYLLIYLSGLAVLSVALTFPRFEKEDEKKTNISQDRSRIMFHGAAILGSILFFIMARPFDTADTRQKLADVLILQYSGPSIKKSFASARSLSNPPGRIQLPVWAHYRSDAEIVRWWQQQFPDSKAVFRPHTVK